MLTVSLSQIARVPSENICRSGELFPDNDSLTTLASQLSIGWNASMGVPVVYKLDDAGIKAALEELEKEYAYWRNFTAILQVTDNVTGLKHQVAPTHLLRAFEAIHVDGKGKLRTPKYGITTCNRRTKAIVATNAMFMVAGKPAILDVPYMEKEYTDALERGVDCLLSNQLDAGRERLNGGDIVAAAKRIFVLGGSEATLTRALAGKRGTAQKAWSLVELDHKFGELGIIDRIVKGELKWASFDKETLRRLARGNEKDAVLPGNEDEVKAYLDNPAKPDGNDPKILDKPKMDAMIARFPVAMIREVIFAIRNNRPEALTKYIDHAVAINALTEKLGLTPPPPPAVAEKK